MIALLKRRVVAGCFGALAWTSGALAASGPPQLTFPKMGDGRSVIAVDLHTHTVFSDGQVWPTVRVDEAVREGLGAIAITDHLEYQPKVADIGTTDRNRPYQIAKDYAQERIHVIPGAEITRQMPPGHFIATFVKDANALQTAPTTSKIAALKGAAVYGEADSFLRALTEARSQGAFVFWAHPVDPPSKTPGSIVQPVHRRAIADGLVQGVEVANPHWGFMREGLEIALKYDLAILGVSDVHKTIEMHNADFGNRHRSVTLVLARDDSLEAISEALRDKATVALYSEAFIGRERELAPLIGGLLSVELVKDRPPPFEDGVVIRVRNDAPVSMRLRSLDGPEVHAVLGEVEIDPRSEREVNVRVGRGQGFSAIRFEVLNTVIGVDRRLEIVLRPNPAAGAGSAPARAGGNMR